MNTKVDPNKKHYFTRLKGDALASTLQQVKTESPIITIWMKGFENRSEEFKILEIGNSNGNTKLILDRQCSLINKLTKPFFLNKDVFVKFKTEKFQYFTTSILKFDEESLFFSIEILDDFFKGQQRKDYRLQANQLNTICITINETTFACLDISAGGTSFIIKKEMEEQFSKGKEFSKVKLYFNKKNFFIPLIKVCGVWDLKESEKNTIPEELKNGVKLGIQFLKMPPETDEELCKHVNTESRAEEVWKLLREK